MRSLLRSAFISVLSLFAISIIPLAQGQRWSSGDHPSNSQTLSNGLHNTTGTKTFVRVHDTPERSQIASQQQITVSPVLALHRVLFVAWSPVPLTARSPLTPMV